MDQQESNYDVIIIGAGVSGLVCAYELEKRNLKPLIIEASDRVGGRIKTTFINGWPLDHGFQILLTGYPEATQYLDFDKLKLKYFNMGAVVFNKDKTNILSDPLREPGTILKMLLSPVGSISDRLKIAKLALDLKKKSIEKIFKQEEKTTFEYLKAKGFSDKIIDQFFAPFFGGIYLENELNTSCRMFEFTFKMFAEGGAAIPENGMEEIPKQLKSLLKTTQFKFNTPVSHVDSAIHLTNGESLHAEKIVIATQPEPLVENLNTQPSYNAVRNLYFKSEKPILNKPTIGLVPDMNMLTNNFHEVSSVINTDNNEEHLISVSVNNFKHNAHLAEQIRSELSILSGMPEESFTFVKEFKILKALPVVEDVKNSIASTEVKLNDNIYLAGDYLLNGSLNAAMKSGRIAAEAVAKAM